jgi:hypothetical protein
VVIGVNGGSTFLAFDDSGFYFNVGGVEWSLTSAGLEQTGGMVKHNGINIGDTHTHKDVQPGGGNSGAPNA